MKRQIRFFAVTFLAVIFGSINIGCVVHHNYGISGSVVDSRTGKPIQGAAVVVVNYTEVGSLGGASYTPKKALEMTSGVDGKFIISPEMVVWGLESTRGQFQLYIFEPNYKFVSLSWYGKCFIDWDMVNTNGQPCSGPSPIVSDVPTNQGRVFEFKLSHLETESQKKDDVAKIFHSIREDTAQFPNFMKVVNTEQHKYGIGE